MKIKTILLIILCTISTITFAQFEVTINAPTGFSCADSVAQFTAVAKDGATVLDDVNFTWSFGDGTADLSGLNLDTVEHAFIEGGGHIIRLDASKGADSDYALLKYEVAIIPNFSGTKSNKEEPICKGQQILLTGNINDSTWVYEVPDKNKEESAVEISDTKPYNSIFDYRIFTESQTITAAADIDSIGINLEHADLSQLKIELICPNNTSIILKDFGGEVGKHFGVPNLTSPENPGTGYDYFWTNTPDNGTMNSVIPTGDALSSGSYTSGEGFNLLIGCPLNGDWTIKVTDNLANDGGFIFTTQLTFEASLLPVDWEYSHTYGFPKWFGSGVHSTSGEGLATANPELYGNNLYTFRRLDDFGCYQDTSLLQDVEPASFEADTLKGPFDLQVTFTNTTSWATEFEWDFGDDVGLSVEENPIYIYEREGIFRAYLTTKTDEGCEDTMSVLVEVTIPLLTGLEDIPNAFTPNNDGLGSNVFILDGDFDAVESLDCYIYSRWGKKVAEWHSVYDATKVGWDGRINGGRDASPGVYYYYIKAIGYDGKEIEKKGALHLFR